jgi:hypothetical protein
MTTESVGDIDVADQLLEHVEAELAERGARTVASAVGF